MAQFMTNQAPIIKLRIKQSRRFAPTKEFISLESIVHEFIWLSVTETQYFVV